MNVKDIRRANLRALAKTLGDTTPMANKLDKSQSQLSQLIGTSPTKNIGDKIAAEVELACNKPPGWLDKEHFTVNEMATAYGTEFTSTLLQTVPIIEWELIAKWRSLAKTYQPATDKQLAPTTIKIGDLGFALQVLGDTMQSDSGESIPKDATIVVDPDATACSGSYVIAGIKQNQNPTFKQLIIDGNRRFLKPLNQLYPIVEINNVLKIYGVVRQMIKNF